MSSKTVSPTANLLRSSRLFSLPPPLARPEPRMRISETATQSYPTQQAIATTTTSKARGDWGLKRSLPNKQLRASNPVLRVNAIDTWEHITDFESASDLTQSLQKFQELNLPVTVEIRDPSAARRYRECSVFEDSIDNTDPNPDPAKQRRLKTRSAATANTNINGARWKFKGPWLAGMTEGQFSDYLDHTLRHRKPEFFKFLRKNLREQLRTENARRRTESGQRGESVPGAAVVVTTERFEEYLLKLRRDMSPVSELARLIESFFDLPASPTDSNTPLLASTMVPPVTHPSAGLSYLRSNATLTNHPILGPQRFPPPQQARILAAQRTVMETTLPERIGIAGIVADAPGGGSSRRRVNDENTDDENLTIRADKDGKAMGVGVDGGNKVWIEPWKVHVRPDGSISLKVHNATDTAVGVKTGALAPPAELEVQYREQRAIPLDVSGDLSTGGAAIRKGRLETRLDQTNVARNEKPVTQVTREVPAGSGYGIEGPSNDVQQDTSRTKTPTEDITSALVSNIEKMTGRDRQRRNERR